MIYLLKTYLFIALCLIALVNSTVNAQTDSLECLKTKSTLKKLVTSVNRFENTMNGTDNRVTSKKIDSVIALNTSCLKQYEISNLYMDLTENLCNTSLTPNIEVYNYFKKAILSGASGAVILNLHTGLYIKDNFPEQYKELEHLADSMYVVSCNRFINVKINLQLGFLLRYMIRKDQDVRTREMLARQAKDTVLTKALLHEMGKVDSVNEILLTEIFEQYGYPGWFIVGGEGSSASMIFEHMSTDFQVKYIHLIEGAIHKQQIFIADKDFHFILDKILLRKYGITLYGNQFTDTPPEKDKAVINKYRKLLNLTEEE
ncbi:MAG: hypothetical protein ABI207_01835 [Crocinitomicaceae bacterium]